MGTKQIKDKLNIPINRVEDLSSYWRGKGRRRSLHGWMIIKKESYDESFDYVGFKKEKISNYKYGKKYSATEYYRIRKQLDTKEIIPYKDRKMKRVPILAKNIETGEEREFKMLKECSPEFNLIKVRKCINNDFGRYKHRGYHFKRA